MSFNNVPANGWPQIKDLEKLDAIAKEIENLPTFTSSDRAWMNEWEQKLPELPEDPETDGVKVLTATTTSGETIKSWETPENVNLDYSTTEHNTGVKWIDGKDIYSKVVTFDVAVSISYNAWFTSDIDATGVENIINTAALADGAFCPLIGAIDNGKFIFLGCRVDSSFSVKAIILYYTKSTT